MGGKIEVESKPGEGSSFRFFVKASLSSNEQYSSQDNLVLPDEKSTDPNANKKVLIVEGESYFPETSCMLGR